MGNKGHKGVREVWEGDNWFDGYGKYRDRRGMGRLGKGPKHSTTHIRLPEYSHPPPPPQARHESPTEFKDVENFIRNQDMSVNNNYKIP